LLLCEKILLVKTGLFSCFIIAFVLNFNLFIDNYYSAIFEFLVEIEQCSCSCYFISKDELLRNNNILMKYNYYEFIFGSNAMCENQNMAEDCRTICSIAAENKNQELSTKIGRNLKEKRINN